MSRGMENFLSKIGEFMAASDRGPFAARSFLIQCSSRTFDHAAWLSAVHSEILCVNEEGHSLRIFPMTELLRTQFEKLGASVAPAAG